MNTPLNCEDLESVLATLLPGSMVKSRIKKMTKRKTLGCPHQPTGTSLPFKIDEGSVRLNWFFPNVQEVLTLNPTAY